MIDSRRSVGRSRPCAVVAAVWGTRRGQRRRRRRILRFVVAAAGRASVRRRTARLGSLAVRRRRAGRTPPGSTMLKLDLRASSCRSALFDGRSRPRPTSSTQRRPATSSLSCPGRRWRNDVRRSGSSQRIANRTIVEPGPKKTLKFRSTCMYRPTEKS